MDDNVIKNLEELNDKRSKQKILSESLRELQGNKKSIWKFLLCIALSLFLSINIAFFSNTVEVTQNVVSILIDVQLAFFSVILGAYAIFQALMRDEIIKELIKTQNNILKESNRTFLNLSILYIVDIFITVIIAIVANISTDEFYVYSILFSNIMFSIFSFIYCVFNLLLILENINFVINLYRMFNVYNIYRALDVLEDTDEHEQ